MNMKKVIRKVAAVGVGLTMVGTTLMGAMATNLNEYPAPFVQDGAFDAVLIVGDSASAVDIIGMTDIAMALQSSNTETVVVESDSGVTVVEGGEVEDELYFGVTPFLANKEYDEGDIEVLMDDDVRYNGNDEDFKETVFINKDSLIAESGQKTEDYGTDVYVEVDQDNSIYYRWTPDSPIVEDTASTPDKLEIEFLGLDLTISGWELGNKVTLTSVDEVWMNYGDSLEVTVKDVDYTIELGNVYETEAVVTVNGVTEAMSEDSTEDFDFEDFEIEMISVLNDDGVDNDAVKISYGSTVSETATDNAAAEMLGYGDDATEAEWVWDIEANATHLSWIGVEYNQDRNEIESELSEDWELPALSLNDEIVFPNEYVKLQFAALNNDLNRGTFDVKLDTSYDWYDEDNNKVFDGANVIIFDAADDAEIFEVGGDSYEKVIVEADSGNSIGLVDSNGAKTTGTYHATTMLDIKVDDDEISVSFTEDVDHNVSAIVLNNIGGPTAATSGVFADDFTWTFGITGDWTEDPDAETGDATYPTGTSIGTRDYEFMTDYGVIVSDIESGIENGYGELTFSFPKESITWDLAVSAQSATSGSSDNTYEKVVPITIGATKLASEVADVKAQNAIVVGGPAVNMAAAELLGNPTQEEILETFTPGQAMVKLFENDGNVAMLIAGYDGEDTRTACKVVANGGIVEIDGMEAVVATLSEAITAPAVVEEEVEPVVEPEVDPAEE